MPDLIESSRKLEMWVVIEESGTKLEMLGEDEGDLRWMKEDRKVKRL